MPSYCWNEFLRVDDEYAVCLVDRCEKKIKHCFGVTGMNYHLEKIHGVTKENSFKREVSLKDRERFKKLARKGRRSKCK
jgi:hypothetical protein